MSVAAGLAVVGCDEDDANIDTKVPTIICTPQTNPPDGRVCGVVVRGTIHFGQLGGGGGSGGGYTAPTTSDVSDLSISTSTSSAVVVPNSNAQLRIDLFSGSGQLIASQMFPAVVNAFVNVTASSPAAISSFMQQYQSQTDRVEMEVFLNEVDEVAGSTNSLILTLKNAGVPITATGVIWTAPCYVDLESGIYSTHDCVFGGT